MQGKIGVTFFGLLLVQAVAAIFFSFNKCLFVFESVVALLFIIAGGVFLFSCSKKVTLITLLIAFSLGLVNIAVLSFSSSSMWLVILLCLDAAGFLLTLDLFDSFQKELVVVKEPTAVKKKTKKKSK